MTQEFRKIKPSEKENYSFNIPIPEQIILDNNISLLYLYREELPIVKTYIVSSTGAKYDLHGKYGIANLTAMLLDEGAGKFNAFELDDRFESMGTHLEIGCDFNSVVFSILSTSEYFDESLDLVSQIIKEPHLKIEDFEREKEKIKTRLIEYSDDPGYISDIHFQKYIFENSNYEKPIAGLIETIETIQHNELVNFYNNNYASNRLKIVVVGNIDRNHLINKLNNIFNSWKTINFEERESNFNRTENKIYLYKKADAPQTEIKLGLRTTKRIQPEFFAKTLINTILGGQFSSRLNSNLREKRGYTYGIHSSFQHLTDTGLFSINTSVKKENTFDALEQIYYELERFPKDLTMEEIAFAKTYLIRKLPISIETYSQIARNFINISQFNLELDYYNKYAHFINSVSHEEIIATYEKLIKLDEIITVLVGDESITSMTDKNILLSN